MIVEFKDLAIIRDRHKREIVVLGGGSFDLLHRGHVKYIQSLKEHGDVVVVMVKSDESIRKHKGADRPIIPEASVRTHSSKIVRRLSLLRNVY